mmetsp:Transcript_8737/g.27104  ORF Transcript_8737/g.27104 Transcript_8737/m.27104 type:complete len:383 (-) Transcript_8737:570-1718(-)
MARPAVPPLGQPLVDAHGGGEGLPRAFKVAVPLKHLATQSEDLRLVLRRKVLEVGGIEQVERLFVLQRRADVRLGLLADLNERLLHLHGGEAVHLVEHRDAHARLAVLARDARQAVDAPGLVAEAQLVQRWVDLVEVLEGVHHHVVHVAAPVHHLRPPLQALPLVWQAQAPRLQDVLELRAGVVLVTRGVPDLHQHARRLLQLHQLLEAEQQIGMRLDARGRQRPPLVQREHDTLTHRLIACLHRPRLQRGARCDALESGRFLALRDGEHVLAQVLPLAQLPQRVELHLVVVDLPRELRHLVPLVELLGTLDPAVLPQADLRFLHRLRKVAAVHLHHAAAEYVLRLGEYAVLHQRKSRGRLLGGAALAPEPRNHVMLAQHAI